jgi:hypothetical protein
MTPVPEAARRFPLIGRGRPACPPLPDRISEVTAAVRAAEQDPPNTLAHAAHALNKAALIASDAGLADRAADLCWLHIDAYRSLSRPLTCAEAQYMLEPVVNIARLTIRQSKGDRAVAILTDANHAVAHQQNLTIDGRTLALATITGTAHARRALREWIWLQLLCDGTRALTLAGRWDDAVALAQAHNGIGAHPMDGRQAAIIARIGHRDLDGADALLRATITTQPWERQAHACMTALRATVSGNPSRRHAEEMAELYAEAPAAPMFVTYRVRLALTIHDLTLPTSPALARHILRQAVADTISTGDGYAARDLLTDRDHLPPGIHAQLAAIKSQSGLARPDDPHVTELIKPATRAAELAARTLRHGQATHFQPTATPA